MCFGNSLNEYHGTMFIIFYGTYFNISMNLCISV